MKDSRLPLGELRAAPLGLQGMAAGAYGERHPGSLPQPPRAGLLGRGGRGPGRAAVGMPSEERRRPGVRGNFDPMGVDIVVERLPVAPQECRRPNLAVLESGVGITVSGQETVEAGGEVTLPGKRFGALQVGEVTIESCRSHGVRIGNVRPILRVVS